MEKRRNMDPEILQMLYTKYWGRVYKEAINHSVNMQIAEDIAQETFIKLCLKGNDVPQEAVGKWLSVTAAHMAIDYQRHYGRETLVDLLFFGDDIFSGDRNFPEEEILQKYKEQEIEMYFQKIFRELYQHNKQWFWAMWLAYVKKLPRDDVADIMKISHTSLRGVLYRARQWVCCNYGACFLSLLNGE